MLRHSAVLILPLALADGTSALSQNAIIRRLEAAGVVITPTTYKNHKLMSITIPSSAFSAEALRDLHQLPVTSLFLEDVSLTNDHWRSITTLEGITELCLSHCGMSVANVRMLGHLRSLTRFTLCDVNLNDEAVQALAENKLLSDLSLRDCHLRPGYLKILATMGGLGLLGLDGTSLEAEDLAALARMPQLRILNISETGLTDPAMKAFPILDRLLDLNIGSNRIGDRTIQELLDRLTPSINSLNISGTDVTDVVTVAIARHEALGYLLADNTTIGNSGLARLAKLANLTVLSMKGTAISDDGLAVLKHSHLAVFDARDTLISLSGKEKLAKLAPRLKFIQIGPSSNFFVPERKER
jgi:hypothetical protein